MLRRCTLLAPRSLSVRRLASVSSVGEGPATPRKVYVIAGEASGDAIGAKTIRALRRQENGQHIEFRGIGGPQMCAAGGFNSLFPMQELSVMGLVEVLPYVWRFRQRIQDTLRDIEQYAPDLVLTIDSKGFTFRVLKALQAKEERDGGIRVKKVHYVAPSVWAYKHRGKRDFTELKRLLDVMFTILPFEEDIFLSRDFTPKQGSSGDEPWCQFVGHPAVEDFLELYGLYDSGRQEEAERKISALPPSTFETLHAGEGALLDLTKYDDKKLCSRGQLLHQLANSGRDPICRTRIRDKLGIPVDAFVICALVGSRSNEVKKTSKLVLEAIDRFQRQENFEKVFVVFPTLAAVEEQVTTDIATLSNGLGFRVLTDLDATTRLQLFQSSDQAIAVSGTIVLETVLANLPTIVIYRANKVTEWIAKRLASVRFVSVPNILLGRSLLRELLFSDCTASKITEAMKSMRRTDTTSNALQLAMAACTLTKWEDDAPSSRLQDKSPGTVLSGPMRASDLVATRILKVLEAK